VDVIQSVLYTCTLWQHVKFNNCTYTSRWEIAPHSMPHTVCAHAGCTSFARASQRTCAKHSASVLCQQNGCANNARKRGRCDRHASRCSHSGCSANIVRHNLCIRHGAYGMCSRGCGTSLSRGAATCKDPACADATTTWPASSVVPLAILYDFETMASDGDHCSMFARLPPTSKCPQFEHTAHLQLPVGVQVVAAGLLSRAAWLTHVTFPDGFRRAKGAVFAGCVNLVAVRFPASISSVGSHLFSDCVNLQTVIIPSDANLKELPDRIFAHCSSLSTFVFPHALRHIGEGAFENSGMTTVLLPPLLRSCHNSAFADCSRLQTLHIGAYCKIIPTPPMMVPASTALTVEQVNQPVASQLTHLNGALYTIPAIGPASYTLPVRIVEMGPFVFARRAWLTDICLNEIVYISNGAFHHCVNLKAAILPRILTVCMGAFEGCTALSTLELNAAVHHIGERAFANCKNLHPPVISPSASVHSSAFVRDSLL